MSNLSFFAELKRRNVLRAATFYAASSWLVVQVATQVFPFFGIENWVVRWIVIAAAIGFPFAMGFSWFYEWTPQGIQRESEVAPDASVTRATGKKMDRWIIAVLSVAVVLLLANTFVLHKDTGVAAVLDKSIAVLPLLNESGDPSQDYFSDGLSEELISALAQLHDIKVIGRNSSFQFRGRQQDDTAAIGAKLGVATLLEGTVRKQGNQIRIVTSLIKVNDGSQLWSQTYDRELKDVFAVQSDIATSVAGALKATLLGKPIESTDRPPSGNLDAYDAMLQGRSLAERRNRADYLKAVEQFGLAIKLDPAYALAYARLAIAEQWFIDWEANADERASSRDLARAHARKAVELNPQLAEAQAALGITQAWSDLDIPAAVASLKKAVALDPENPEILYLMADVTSCLGRFDESIALIRKAIARDRINATLHFYMGQYLLAAGHLHEAQAEANSAIVLQPSATGYHWLLANVLLKRGDANGALAAVNSEPSEGRRDQVEAMAYWMKGDHAASDAVMGRLVKDFANVSSTLIAEVYSYRGENDKALSWLEQGLAMRHPSITEIYELVFLGPLVRHDSRFTAITRQLGLPDAATLEKATEHAVPASPSQNTP